MTENGGGLEVAAEFRAIWFADFEYARDDNGRPWVVCMVARELRTGQSFRLWRDELLKLDRAPFDVGPDALFVAYAAWAELGCFLVLGWSFPVNVLDLFVEHRAVTNGLRLLAGNSLLGALAYRGLAHIDAGEKQRMRDLVMNQQHWTDSERVEIFDYCDSDVRGLAALFMAMVPTMDWPRALIGVKADEICLM